MQHSHAATTLRFAAAGAHSCSQYMVICIHALQNNKGEPITRQNERSATAAQTRYPSSPPAATLHGKTQGFVLRPPSQPKSHATGMQPVQSVLQQQVHIHAAMYIAICTHALQNTKGEPITRQSERSATAAQTRYPSSPPAATLHGKRKVSCSDVLPNTKSMQHSWSHYNAFCSSRCTFMQPIHGDLHPRVAELQGRTNHTSKRTVRTRRTDEVPASAPPAATLRGNAKFRARASSPTQSPCNIHAAITMRFAAAGGH